MTDSPSTEEAASSPSTVGAVTPTSAGDHTTSSTKDASKATWGELEISQRAFGYMPFRNFHVSIYEHSNTVRKDGDERKYFCSPLVILVPESAESVYNEITKQPQVRFDVELWNQDVEAEVIEYLTRVTKTTVHDHQVTVIPFEEVILSSLVSSELFDGLQGWVPYQLHERVLFTLNCPSMESAKNVVKIIQKDPVQFASVFRVKFSLTTRESRKKETHIRMENVTSGKLFGKLEQQCPTKEYVYLTAEDAKILLSESVNNVLVESFSDNEVVSAGLETPIYSILEKMMVASKEMIDGDGKKWDSVFWNDENSRPDRVAEMMNESLEKFDDESKKKLVGEFDKSLKGSLNLGQILKSIGGGVELGTHSKTDEEELKKKCYENRNILEWKGEKFIPKNLSLSKINLSKIRTSQDYSELKTSITYSMAILTMTINVINEEGVGQKKSQQEKSNKSDAPLLYYIDLDADKIESSELSTNTFLTSPEDIMRKIDKASEVGMFEIEVYSQPMYHFQPLQMAFYDLFVILKTFHVSTREPLFWSIEYDKGKGFTLQKSKDEKKLLRDCRKERRPSNWFAPVVRVKSACVQRGYTVKDLLDFVWGNSWDRIRKPFVVFDSTNKGFAKTIFNQFKTGGWEW